MTSDLPGIGDVVYRDVSGEWEVFVDTDGQRSIRRLTSTEATPTLGELVVEEAHYITAIADIRGRIVMTCRCGWISGTRGDYEDLWEQHKALGTGDD